MVFSAWLSWLSSLEVYIKVWLIYSDLRDKDIFICTVNTLIIDNDINTRKQLYLHHKNDQILKEYEINSVSLFDLKLYTWQNIWRCSPDPLYYMFDNKYLEICDYSGTCKKLESVLIIIIFGISSKIWITLFDTTKM